MKISKTKKGLILIIMLICSLFSSSFATGTYIKRHDTSSGIVEYGAGIYSLTQENCTGYPATTQELEYGWNEVNLSYGNLSCCIDDSPEVVFESIYEEVDWVFEDVTWINWHKDEGGNTLHHILPDTLYSVKVDEDCTLTVPFDNITVYRTVYANTEKNNFSSSNTLIHSGNVTLKVPVSSSVQGIIDVTNNTCGTTATEVNSTDELVNNTFWYDSVNQYVHIRTIDLIGYMELNWTVNCSYGVVFNLIIPPYLEVGQYFHSEGFISDGDGNAVSGMIAETRLLYPNGTDALSVNPKHNCTNGNYHCTFSTSILLPGIYSVSIEFVDPSSGIKFKEGSTLYLSVDPGSGIYVSTFLHFTFYNNNTGIGIPSESFKIYASTDTTIDSTDRIYTDLFDVYTGQTIYYRVDDYFDNKIYPSTGSYQTLEITSLEQFEDVPIDWYSFSVKNMNHSIVHFKMTNGSRTYPQYLYPYEPFYWDVLPGEYTINLTYYNPIDDSIVSYTEENITITDDTYYWIRGYDLRDIILEIQITNSSLDALIISVTANVNISGSSINTITTNIVSNLTATETNITNLINSYSSNYTIIESVVDSISNSLNLNFSIINATLNTIDNKLTIDFDILNSTIDYINTTIWNEIDSVNSSLTSLIISVTTDINITNASINTIITKIISNLTITETNITNLINSYSSNFTIIESVVNNINNTMRSDISFINSTLNTMENTLTINIGLLNSTVDYINTTIWNELTFMNTSVGEVNTRIINIWTSQNSSFGNLENRSMIVFSIYNTNEALGLNRDTLKVYINGTRLIGNIYYANRTDVLNLTIKDYYNSTLYQGNHTVVAPLTFIDLGLTFHSWLFGNKNNVDYMISILKQGGSRWWERGIVPQGEREFIIPSGTYAMRIYDADYNEIYNSSLPASLSVVNSRVYVIHGTNLSEIISGQSVIRGQLLELSIEIDYALMPDVTIISRNPPMIFSVYDVEGMAFGNDFYMICPPLITIATTRVTTYGNWINSTPMVPGNGSVLNGTVTILRDVLYLSGPNSITWVNITYTGNGSLFGNTSYIPSRIDIYGDNLTINASSDISVLRVTKFNQVKKFDWTYYPFSGYGPDLERSGWHSAGIEIINSLGVPLYEVFVIAGFSDESNPDGSSVEIRDTTNGGVILEKGPDYDITDTSVHFNLLSMTALETRAFTIGYYKMQQESFIYDEGTVSIPTYDTTVFDGDSYNTFPVHWNNPHSETFKGALYIKLNFDVPIGIDTTSMRIYDLTNDHELDPTTFIPGDKYIRISAEGMGDVLPGGSRKFDVYFLMETFVGADPKELHLNTQLWMGVSLFLIILLAGVCFIIAGVALAVADKKEKRDRWKVCAAMGVFIIVVIIVLQSMGL